MAVASPLIAADSLAFLLADGDSTMSYLGGSALCCDCGDARCRRRLDTWPRQGRQGGLTRVDHCVASVVSESPAIPTVGRLSIRQAIPSGGRAASSSSRMLDVPRVRPDEPTTSRSSSVGKDDWVADIDLGFLSCVPHRIGLASSDVVRQGDGIQAWVQAGVHSCAPTLIVSVARWCRSWVFGSTSRSRKRLCLATVYLEEMKETLSESPDGRCMTKRAAGGGTVSVRPQ